MCTARRSPSSAMAPTSPSMLSGAWVEPATPGARDVRSGDEAQHDRDETGEDQPPSSGRCWPAAPCRSSTTASSPAGSVGVRGRVMRDVVEVGVVGTIGRNAKGLGDWRRIGNRETAPTRARSRSTRRMPGARLDKALSDLVADVSRSRLKALVEEGCVTVGGEVVRAPRHAVAPGPDGHDRDAGAQGRRAGRAGHAARHRPRGRRARRDRQAGRDDGASGRRARPTARSSTRCWRIARAA